MFFGFSFVGILSLSLLEVQPMRSMLQVCLLLTAATLTASSQQAIVGAAKDNTLYQSVDGAISNGAGSHFFAGRNATTGGGLIRRALVKFDIAAAVPAGAAITAVELRLNMSRTNSGPLPVGLRKLTANWGEGASNADANEGGGVASTTGDATWIHRFKATANWTTAGGDAVGTTSASLVVDAAGVYTWTSTPQMVADVQGWLNDTSSNFGWMIIGDEESAGTSKRFDSRENPTQGNRPQLTVHYTTGTSVDRLGEQPRVFALEGNYPNPFNPTTQIRFTLPMDQSARLSIYNLLGVRVVTLTDRMMSAGRHTVTWDATGMPSGLYFVRLEAGGMSEMKRMILTK
jgi:hypothetical protein